MKHQLSGVDLQFLADFESCTFKLSEFDHRAHVRLAYVFLVNNSPDEAVEQMRAALNRFLDYNGIDPGKFHETLTRAWILAVHHFMAETPTSDSADSFIEQNTVLLDSKIMLSHYSAETLFSDEAKSSFVEPNIEPIPRHDTNAN